MKEYSKLKKQLIYEEYFADKYDEDNENYEVKTYTTIDDKIESNDIIEEVLKILNPFDAQIIKMLCLQNMTQKQISKKLNISQSLLQYRLHKYKNKIKKILNANQ